jgi:hypothetical protein
MSNTHKLLKKIAYDTVGVTLIIGALLLGWLPGPGGIPLLLAGLAVLSVHHDWAKRWLITAKESGLRLGEKIFVDHPVVKFMIDIVGLLLLVASFALISRQSKNIVLAFGVASFFIGMTLILGNRRRLQRMVAKFKQK